MSDLHPDETLAQGLVRRFAERTIRKELEASLRRAVWVGEPAPEALPRDRPLVLYANHHYYPDSYLLWHLITQVLRRPMLVWMEAWDQAPLFGPVGALPFPEADPRERMRTIRETGRRMERDTRTALYLYPEGAMRVPEDGLGDFRADLGRLARVLPEAVAWVPVGVRLVWWGESRPTALLGAGAAHDAPDGAERDRLGAVLARLEAARPEAGHRVLLEGTAGADERWDLSRTAPFFKRLTFGG
ncbi:MAG: 1-acyl-sn-glycerol-3-phosphate acyltransferase [Bacteroidota bacterium]